MKTIFRSLAICAALIAVAGCPEKAPPPKELPAPPAVTSFTADKTRIDPGESVTLTFTATNADTISIVTDQGDAVAITGDTNGGTATVTPAVSTVFLLNATGPGGKDSAFVRVGVGEDLSEVFLSVVPAEIEAGQEAQLIWSADKARAAKIVSSQGEDIAIDAAQGVGVVTITPERTTTYGLVASGVDPKKELGAEATVTVRTVLNAFDVTPRAAKVDENIVITWSTGGADEVILSEDTFGELLRSQYTAEMAQVDSGTFTFKVPQTLPNGAAVTNGFPLRFTLTVVGAVPKGTIHRSIQAFVGEGAQIVSFQAPAAVTNGKPVTVSWKTINASQVALKINGLLVFETLKSDPARAAKGTYTLPAIGEDLALELVATTANGVSVTKTATVLAVAAPTVTSFTVTPGVGASGDAATAAWKTANAFEVNIRTLSGPSVFSTNVPANVADGTTQLYPANTTTYVLEAYNRAGDVATATATVTVGTPADVTVSPTPATPGTTVTLQWNLDPATTMEVLGAPTPVPVTDSTGAGWNDLTIHVGASQLVFDDPNDSVAKVPLLIPFRFPFVDGVREAFYVSTNGLLTFSEPASSRPTNVDLTANAKVGDVIAPYWDDLILGAGSVYYVVQGTQFPRTLIIQWNKVSLAQDPATELSFQVQLDESGEFRFVFHTLTGAGINGDSATIGVNVSDGLFTAQHGFDQVSVSANDQLTWFGSGPLQGSVALVPQKSGTYGFVSRRQDDTYQAHSRPVWVFGAESLQVSEVMVEAGPGALKGRWIELYNAQDVAVNVQGIELTETTSMTTYTLPSLIIPPKSFYVFGESVDPMENGGADVDEVYQNLVLGPAAGTVELKVLGTTLSSVAWTAPVTSPVSVQRPETAIDTNGAALTCTRSQTYGAAGAIGTPGAINETCFEYRLVPITEAFEDISTTGTPLFSGAADDKVESLDLGMSPVTYFKTPVTELTVSSNGWVAFAQTTTSGLTNKTKPSATAPSGLAAIFWDDLKVDGTATSNVFTQRLPPVGTAQGRWIIQWHNATHFLAGDTLQFQVKFFDDGTIEYHYATMVSGSSSNYANGNSATIWLERPAGDAALPIGINQAVILPHTAYAYIPKP